MFEGLLKNLLMSFLGLQMLICQLNGYDYC